MQNNSKNCNYFFTTIEFFNLYFFNISKAFFIWDRPELSNHFLCARILTEPQLLLFDRELDLSQICVLHYTLLNKQSHNNWFLFFALSQQEVVSKNIGPFFESFSNMEALYNFLNPTMIWPQYRSNNLCMINLHKLMYRHVQKYTCEHSIGKLLPNKK